MVDSVPTESRNRGETKDAGQLLPIILKGIESISRRLDEVAERVAKVGCHLEEGRQEKEWYSTSEVGEILGKSDFTVRERWCNAGRIDCEKDEYSGRWKIPAREVERLRNGGGLRPVA